MARTRRFLPLPLSADTIARNQARLAEQRAKANAG
jgi:hypothetical protein